MLPGMARQGDPAYALGKLGWALFELVGPGEMKERLLAAGIVLVPVHPRDFPEHLREEYTRLRRSLTWLPTEKPDHGTLHSTIEAMSMEEAKDTAQQILQLYVRMRELYD